MSARSRDYEKGPKKYDLSRIPYGGGDLPYIWEARTAYAPWHILTHPLSAPSAAKIAEQKPALTLKDRSGAVVCPALTLLEQ